MKATVEMSAKTVIRLLIILLIIFLGLSIFIEPLRALTYERYEGLEKQIGVPGTTEISAPPLTPYQPDIEKEVFRIISEEPETYYVSEIGCRISKDIYEDFTKFGEGGKDNSLRYVDLADAFNEQFNCEWIWDYSCCYSKPPIERGKYKCLIGAGVFAVGKDKIISSVDITSLANSGCTDCTYLDDGNNVEYELDEVCINKNLAIRYFPSDSETSFCTDETDEYLRIDYEIAQERQKFGNSEDETYPDEDVYYGCYVNPDNDASWRDSCRLCKAEGTRDDGTDLTKRDYDRIYEWKADDSYNFKIVDDRPLDSNKPLIPGKKYFYTVYWNNDDEDTEDGESRGYEIEFPSVISYDFTEVEDEYNYNDFLDFVAGFFDQTSDSRKTTAGRWFSELRTIYDGIITLTDDVSLSDIQDKLESTTNAFAPLVTCTPDIDCSFYTIGMEPWAESGGSQYIFDIFPINIRRSDNIGTTLSSGGRYRVIIRNWVSNWYHAEDGGTCNYYWCLDESRAPGEKIYCTGDYDPIKCSSAEEGPTENKYVYYRYADKAIIIIKLPSCTETDGGVDYYNYGEVTLDDGVSEPVTDPDECMTGTYLIEKYCSDEGTIGSESYECSDGCAGGECLPSTEFDFRISLDPESEITCKASGVSTTVRVERISGTSEVVTLSVVDSPPDASITFTPSNSGNPNPWFERDLVINPSSSTPAGEYYVKVKGTAGSKEVESDPFDLTITEPKYKCEATILTRLCGICPLCWFPSCTTTEECIDPTIDDTPCCWAECYPFEGCCAMCVDVDDCYPDVSCGCPEVS